MNTPAYKAMFVLGLFDIPSIFTHSLITGFLGFYGFAYCDYPRVFFLFGNLALGLWFGCSVSSLTLALIRVVDVCPHLKLGKLFTSRAIYALFGLFWAYALYGGVLTKPPIFTTHCMSWFFDPAIGNDVSIFLEC